MQVAQMGSVCDVGIAVSNGRKAAAIIIYSLQKQVAVSTLGFLEDQVERHGICTECRSDDAQSAW